MSITRRVSETNVRLLWGVPLDDIQVDTPGVRVDSADHRTTRCSSYTVVVTHTLGISYPQVGKI